MVQNHLRSLSAPKTWTIKRKKQYYVTRPQGIGQKMDFTMPLGIVFKDMLKYCKTAREVRKILQEKEICVDEKRVKRTDHSIGLFSTLAIKTTNEYFRLTINKNGKLELKKIDKAESTIIPSVVKTKKVLGKNKIQINFSDGRNLLLKKDDYATGDSIILSLPKQDVKEHIKLEKNAVIFLTGGKHIGTTGIVEEVENNNIKFVGNDKKTYETEKRYAVAIGIKKAIITV